MRSFIACLMSLDCRAGRVLAHEPGVHRRTAGLVTTSIAISGTHAPLSVRNTTMCGEYTIA
jgi:hypothetical protein